MQTGYVKLLQYVAVSAIVLFMTAQPLVELVFHVTDTNHQLCDIYDDEESKETESQEKESQEKENQEKKVKEHKYCTSNDLEGQNLLSTVLILSNLDLHHNQLIYIMEHFIAVLSPPPELV